MIQRFKPGKKTCIVCKAKFDKNINAPFQNWCSPDCALVIVTKKRKEAQEKEAKSQEKQWNAEKKVMSENLMTYDEWLKKLEKEINPIARLIDYGLSCISCGNYGKPQAGHYHTVKSDGAIRFNLHNIHIQDYHCNVQKSANIIGYDEGLILQYGRVYWEYVKFDIKRIYPVLKLSIPEIKEKIELAREIKKTLEKSTNRERTPEERIILRDEINLQLGMYNIRFTA